MVVSGNVISDGTIPSSIREYMASTTLSSLLVATLSNSISSRLFGVTIECLVLLIPIPIHVTIRIYNILFIYFTVYNRSAEGLYSVGYSLFKKKMYKVCLNS